jgi:ATP-binding cassette, subfamily F, member 3
MLWIHEVSKSFGPQTLFERVQWQVNPGQRVGLIGPNGAGKSTLIKIISGMIEPDHGQVNTIKGLKLGYLPQEVAELGSNTIRDEASKGLASLWMIRDEVEALANQLAHYGDQVKTSAYEETLAQYGVAQARFEQEGGFEAESKVEQVLCGLGFPVERLDHPCDTLSGGWQMRVVLARLLLQAPGLLLLDEPTNHLDLESVGWLKHFLNSFEGSLILISHDRWFLNEICTHIAELTQSGVGLFTGNFEDYLVEAEHQQALLERQRKNQSKKTANLERFIDRFRYKASKAKQVQSRVKILEKMQTVEESKEVQSIHFHLVDPPKCGRIVMTLNGIEQGYHKDQLIYRGLDIKVERGQHLALVGPNGAGKSTLLKLLAGVVEYRRGFREVGHLVKPYYFAQHQTEALNMGHTVFQEAQSAQEGASVTHIRSILGAFLFDAEDVKKKVAVLSGGEKNRLALVRMLLTPSNLLLLDEPTNHLDMGSRAVLAQALRAYEGAVVLISHDRYFIDEVCDEVWEVNTGRVTPFLSDYSDYLERVQRGDRPLPFPLSAPPPIDQDQSADHSSMSRKVDRKEERRKNAEKREARAKILKPLKRDVQKAEDDIQRLEERLVKLEALQCASDHYDQPDEVVRVAKEVKGCQNKLEKAMSTWEEVELALSEATELLDQGE